MEDKLFVIGIGGTGMRCLEALVHSCAMGLYDKTQINILALDTDFDNGNFSRLKDLVLDVYLKAKGNNKPHVALENTFFSAKLNFFTFSPDYSQIGKNGKFSSLANSSFAPKHEQDLASLLLTENVREFDLKHGYRAQTHLGSLLMYHAILEDVEKNTAGQLRNFVNELHNASESGNAKLFIMGSVFGGTGASSIPILPKALNDAMGIIDAGKNLAKVFFGATLLTSYFKFPAPDDKQRQSQKVIASAKNFALNSQMAMMFYNEDPTVRSTFQKFYMLGTPSNDYETKQAGTETVTGGRQQKNDAHYIELLCASAAYDFFKTPAQELEKTKKEDKSVRYFYRAIDDSGRLEFKDFASPDFVNEFAKRFAMMVAFSFLVLPEHTDFYAAAQAGVLIKHKIEGYEDIDPAEVSAMKKYCAYFHFDIDAQGQLTDGWLRQLHRSANGTANFLFHPELFGIQNKRELEKYKYNEDIFREDESFVARKTFKTSFFGKPYNSFMEAFIQRTEDPSLTNKCEKLTKRMFQTLETLYGF